MEAFARVQRIDNDRVWLKVLDAGGGCGRCHEPGGCRSVQITQAFGLPRDEFALPRKDGVGVGDRVRIAIADGAPLRAALLSYGLGAALLLIGAAVGAGVTDGNADLGAGAGALGGLALAVLFNRILPRSRTWRAGLQMEIAPETACLHPDGKGSR
ncbi:MAG: SoxR reducing system RseC family protein [Thauera phenolivorans]|uniref:SoxR reducing system RseC family protein n=1 Tax=Thauera phenolivorans TaxID=1792543 RepID=A0A7X7R8T3_9RHOO|nr:SoxR reducing system RseC family protein [Thauera phenolivorans]NLF54688.1 SoxR reducing system RseC family protein [Thauera phenolivorans]